MATRAFLAQPEVSRRAVYHTLEWLVDLPSALDDKMLPALLTYRLKRQSKNHADAGAVAEALCGVLASTPLASTPLSQRSQLSLSGAEGRWKSHLRSLLTHAEFLARETRGSDPAPEGAAAPEATQ